MGHKVNNAIEKSTGAVPAQEGQSPETYLGYSRGERFKNTDQFKADTTVEYTLASILKEHEWSLGGSWQIGPMDTVSKGDDSKLAFQFTAKEVYLVMNGPSDKPVSIKLNGEQVTSSNKGGEDVDASGFVHLNGARLYKLISLPIFASNQRLEITVPKGATVNAFTFGG